MLDECGALGKQKALQNLHSGRAEALVDVNRSQLTGRQRAWSIGLGLRGESKMGTVTYRGGCHCGRGRFEVDAPARLEVDECNCSMCAKTAYLHLIVAKPQFRLVAGGGALPTYRFNTGAAQHLFCSICGVKSFYQPRSHPDAWSINAHCLNDQIDLEIEQFDGRDWERAKAALDENGAAG